MKHFLVLSLFFLSCVITKGNTLSFETIPHPNVLLFQNINQDSIVLLKTKNRIKNFARAQKYDSAIFYSKELLDLSVKFSDSIYIEEANFRLGYYYKTTGHLEQAFTHYNNSFKILRDIGDSTSAASRLTSMANIQKGLGDYVGSKITAVDGLNYLKNNLNFKRISSLQHIISVCFRELKDYHSALKWNEKALITLKKTKEDIPHANLIIIKNTRANILFNQKKYVESVSILSGLIGDSIVVNNQKEYARILSNLGYIKWLENKNNIISDSLLTTALALREKLNDTQGLIASNIHLTKYNFEKNPSRALYYAESAYKNALKRNSLTAIIEALGYLFQLKENTNSEAKIYHQTNEKLKYINQKNRDTYAVTKYENEKLLADISEKEKQFLSERNKKISYLSSLFILCLLTLFMIYFFRQRTKILKQKSKAEKLVAINETEAELSRKLHDDHGGKLNKVMSLIQRDADKGLILDVIEGIYNHTRDFSRELNVVNTGPNYWKTLKATLEYTKPQNVAMILDGGIELNWFLVSGQTKTILFKVLQELVINMTKHSEANQTVILFKEKDKELHIYYEDDGKGASKESLLRKNGLLNTEKRIQAIGGSITFDSEEGKGFRAEIRTPK